MKQLNQVIEKMEVQMRVQEEKTHNMQNRYEEQIEFHLTTIDEHEMQIANLQASLLKATSAPSQQDASQYNQFAANLINFTEQINKLQPDLSSSLSTKPDQPEMQPISEVELK